jgi:hypothetical protein
MTLGEKTGNSFAASLFLLVLLYYFLSYSYYGVPRKKEINTERNILRNKEIVKERIGCEGEGSG